MAGRTLLSRSGVIAVAVALLLTVNDNDQVRAQGGPTLVDQNLELRVFPGLDHHSLPASAEFRDAILRFIKDRK